MIREANIISQCQNCAARIGRQLYILVLACLLSTGLAASPTGQTDENLATVNGVPISLQDYYIELRNQARQRFYHGKPAESQIAEFKQEVADQLIDNELIYQEAQRRAIKADSTEVDRLMARYQERSKAAGGAVNEQFWAKFRDQLERQQILKAVRSKIENGVTDGGDQKVRQYYSENPDKFTEPSSSRVSVILLKVDPSSGTEQWRASEQEAGQLVGRLRNGDDFAEMARIHSGDVSAEKGGDMGFVHAGMLGKPAQELLDQLALGEISDPLKVLEGYVIFKVSERRAAVLHEYERVRERAQMLWLRESKEQAWNRFLEGLHNTAEIKVNQEYITAQEAADSQVDNT